MQTQSQTTMTLNDFVEHDSLKKEVLKRQLSNSELESIESPIYIIWNVAAIIIGF